MSSWLPSDIFAVVLAGGEGTRLWPYSRKSMPKQLLSFEGQNTLFQNTLKRLLTRVSPKNLLIVTNADLRFEVMGQATEINLELSQNVYSEPMAKNTLPAIAWMTAEIQARNPNAIVSVFPSDHLVQNEDVFLKDWEQALESATQGHVTLLGIEPTYPSTAFGYIECDKTAQTAFLPVTAFHEKPDKKTAASYLEQACFYWNAGMFIFQTQAFDSLLKQHAPQTKQVVSKLLSCKTNLAPKEIYAEFESQSIDYALLEKASGLRVVPGQFSWNDLGNWKAVKEALPSDPDNNLKQGHVVTFKSQNNLVWGDQHLTVCYGVNDLAVIRTQDVVLVTTLEHAEQLKDLLDHLKTDHQHELTFHPMLNRPWGRFEVLEEESCFKVKRILVKPGHKLSLQKHEQRSEHWVVVKGKAQAQADDVVRVLEQNDSFYVHPQSIHRLENIGSEMLEIIEVQIGAYLGEDDITRFEDSYGR
ncbi:MAG: mannose-1-phosphate guanylyltransferase/mannose-6-phosphate isomerase [Deltaproteobacteria bacterium]|nr:mannose-1-phosphate guanylyltransferase/mannose-6-phosphate isomerase [Deltaproteobacteria bacterium]